MGPEETQARRAKVDCVYSEIVNGCCSLHIPNISSNFCCQPCTSLWSRQNLFRAPITYFCLLSCFFTLIIPIYMIVYTITCYTDHVHGITAVRNVFASFFVVPIIVAIWNGGFGWDGTSICPQFYGEIIKLIQDLRASDEDYVARKKTNLCKRIFYKCLFSCPLLVVLSLLQILIPLLNEHVWASLYEGNFLQSWSILYGDFVGTCIRIYHYQFFWIICYGIHNSILIQLQPIVEDMKRIGEVETTGSENDICRNNIRTQARENLKAMRKRCAEIVDVIATIDDNIHWFIFFGVMESTFGIATPLFLYINFLKTENTWRTHVLYIPWLAVRVIFFLYSFKCALGIPSAFKESMSRYKIAVHKYLGRDEWTEFQDSFQFARKELFDKPPSFTIGGILNMQEMSFALVAGVKVFLTFDILSSINEKFVFQNITRVADYYFANCEQKAIFDHIFVNASTDQPPT